VAAPATSAVAAPTAAPATSPSGVAFTESPAVVPTGAPQTGLGGAAHSGANTLMLALSGAALFGAIAATGLALRRRQPLVAPTDGNPDEG
jgi:hypothetical protein